MSATQGYLSSKQARYIAYFMLFVGTIMLAFTHTWLMPRASVIMAEQMHYWLVGVILLGVGYIGGTASVLIGAVTYLLRDRFSSVEPSELS